MLRRIYANNSTGSIMVDLEPEGEPLEVEGYVLIAEQDIEDHQVDEWYKAEVEWYLEEYYNDYS